MSLLDRSARELLDLLASSDPTPGGGSAAALAGAIGAALACMVCGMPKTRTGAREERSRLDDALAHARTAGERLRGLVDEDTAAYDAVVEAYRLPKGSEDEKAARKEAIAEAMTRATEIPLGTAETCLAVLGAARIAAADGNPNAGSDALSAGALAWAGLLGALANVGINIAGQADAGLFEERSVSVLREGREHAEALGIA